jgi:Lrp/AsnC family transcriptional regulator, leucine-responsive regulatory protein
MDAIDQAIVRLLERHGRLSQEQLARRVRLSRPAVHQRVKRLEAAGVLQGPRAVLDVRAASPLALQELIDRVRAVAGVQATMTTLALSSLHGTLEATP